MLYDMFLTIKNDGKWTLNKILRGILQTREVTYLPTYFFGRGARELIVRRLKMSFSILNGFGLGKDEEYIQTFLKLQFSLLNYL